MTITYDTSADKGGLGTSATPSTTYTCGGVNRIVFVFLTTTSTTDNITGISYAGVSMTRATFGANVTSIGTAYVYYLINPSTAAGASVTISKSDAVQTTYCQIISYTGAKQSAQPDASNTFSDIASTSSTHSLTTVADKSVVVMLGASSTGAVSPGAGSTQRQAWGAGDGMFIFDSGNTGITPPASTSMSATATSGNWSIAMVSIAPLAAGSINSNFLAFM